MSFFLRKEKFYLLEDSGDSDGRCSDTVSLTKTEKKKMEMWLRRSAHDTDGGDSPDSLSLSEIVTTSPFHGSQSARTAKQMRLWKNVSR
jgi:hypothetical protein